MFFFKSSGDRFFDTESLSIDLLVMVPDFFEVTFDSFFPGPENRQNGQNWLALLTINFSLIHVALRLRPFNYQLLLGDSRSPF